MAASSLDGAASGVLKEFLPALDKLKAQKAMFEDNEFGKNYAGLTGAMESALGSMGLQEYSLAPGDEYSVLRVNAVEKKHSDEFAANTVIECLTAGYEVKGGSVLRPAECVVSLGQEGESEAEAEANEEEDSGSE